MSLNMPLFAPDTCLRCGGSSLVNRSRSAEHFRTRRRICILCGDRWTTYETRQDPWLVGKQQAAMGDMAALVDDTHDLTRILKRHKLKTVKHEESLTKPESHRKRDKGPNRRKKKPSNVRRFNRNAAS